MTDDRTEPTSDKPNPRQVLDAFFALFKAGKQGNAVEGVRSGPKPGRVDASPGRISEEWTAERVLHHVLGPGYDIRELGPEIRPGELPGKTGAVREIGGKRELVAFLDFQADWLESLDDDRIAALTMLADMGVEAIQILQAMARKEIERRIVRKAWKRARWIAIVAAGSTFWFAEKLADKITFFKEKGPVLREGWKWLLGFLT